MMILAYLIFIGLLSRTSGHVPVVSLSKPYVNKSETVTITCTVAGISDSVVISKDGINLIRCIYPPLPCSTLDPVATAYVAVQNMTAGTTAVTIGPSSISRDTGNWTCLYGAASRSAPISLAVVTPSSSSRLIEEPEYIILELNCIYPNRSLGLTFYLLSSYLHGAIKYTEGSLEERSVPCDDYEASLNYTLKFPSQHSNSYYGIFNVFYNNDFYVARISGSRLYTFSSSSTNDSTNTASGYLCKRELGLGLGLGLGILSVITSIIVVIVICKGYTYAYKLGLLLGLGIGSTFQVGWIIIVSLISAGDQCKLGLGLGLGLGSGLQCVIACIVAVILMRKGSPSRVNIGKGILTGLLIASVIGIIVVYLLFIGEKPDERPQELTGQKNKTRYTGTQAVHTGTQNKVESKTTSKQTNDRHQPLIHVDTGVEDRPTIRPLPPPAQNSDIKDRNPPGISVNFDDTRGLANETLRPHRLPPLTQKQPTVQEQDASKEPTKEKKRKRKKKSSDE